MLIDSYRSRYERQRKCVFKSNVSNVKHLSNVFIATALLAKRLSEWVTLAGVSGNCLLTESGFLKLLIE